MNKVSVGQLVVSRAGHDSERKFVVTCIINEQYVYISDGTLKKVESPKKKNIKHFKLLNVISDDIKNKIESGQKITNSEIRSFIKSQNGYGEQEV
jgi:ribosomal protein L14E/L6E/L27E